MVNFGVSIAFDFKVFLAVVWFVGAPLFALNSPSANAISPTNNTFAKDTPKIKARFDFCGIGLTMSSMSLDRFGTGRVFPNLYPNDEINPAPGWRLFLTGQNTSMKHLQDSYALQKDL